mmetsp:Transcript_37204/g.76171  ORF Transcript_37204/g.76171 Transcript_37204/m.76171 type:complete len:118 (+) Transcript_37204:29-382(+)|eukprot:s2122_g5.t1
MSSTAVAMISGGVLLFHVCQNVLSWLRKACAVTIACGGGSSASRDISTVYCSDWACANPSFPAMLSLTPPSAIEVLLPTDDFVQHFGVCQQIMQRRMSFRGDLPPWWMSFRSQVWIG